MLKKLNGILTSPQWMKRANGILTIFWLVMIPVSIITGWIGSVTYVAALSLWALVAGHWSAWQAARVEVHQDEDANVGEVLDEVRKLLQTMNCEPSGAVGDEERINENQSGPDDRS